MWYQSKVQREKVERVWTLDSREIMWICNYLLTCLEVELLDSEDEDEGEEGGPSTHHDGHIFHEAFFISKGWFYVRGDVCDISTRVWDGERCRMEVTELRGDQSVQCPSQGADPVVPDPPHRNILQQIQGTHMSVLYLWKGLNKTSFQFRKLQWKQ